MPKSRDAVHIPLREEEAIRLAFRMKPTATMPKPGAHATGPKKKQVKKESFSRLLSMNSERFPTRNARHSS
jgi:hypothetical protein